LKKTKEIKNNVNSSILKEKVIEEDKSFSGCAGLAVSFMFLVFGLAPMGIINIIEKNGWIPFFDTKPDNFLLITVTVFLFSVFFFILYISKSKKMIRVVTWVVLILALVNFSGCMAELTDLLTY